MNRTLVNFSKIKIILSVIVFTLTITMFTGCSGAQGYNEETTENSNLLKAPQLPLEVWKEEYLFENIPAPENADVYVLTESDSDGWKIYSFSFENFTLEEAREYISVLESDNVKREEYDEYYENEIPMLNYMGYVNDSLAVTLSQCGESGGMTINVRAD